MSEECGYEDNDCLQCKMNIEGCGWDGGDCEEQNKALQGAYPNCTEVQFSTFVGDGDCDVMTIIKECGWDGGDCGE